MGIRKIFLAGFVTTAVLFATRKPENDTDVGMPVNYGAILMSQPRVIGIYIPERQLDLLNPPAPRVRADDVVTLCVHLQRAQDGVFKPSKRWVTARALRDAYPAWSDRQIRAIAAASEGQIISGQKGYCLTACATNEEVKRAVAWLRSQARKMESRAADILRRHRV